LDQTKFYKLEQDIRDITPPTPVPALKKLKPKEQEIIQLIERLCLKSNKQQTMNTIMEILKKVTRQDLLYLDCTSLEFEFSFH